MYKIIITSKNYSPPPGMQVGKSDNKNKNLNFQHCQEQIQLLSVIVKFSFLQILMLLHFLNTWIDCYKTYF